MTVRELITELQKLDPEEPVGYYDTDYGFLEIANIDGEGLGSRVVLKD